MKPALPMKGVIDICLISLLAKDMQTSVSVYIAAFLPSILSVATVLSGVGIAMTTTVVAAADVRTVGCTGCTDGEPAWCPETSVIFVEATPDIFNLGKFSEVAAGFRRRGINSFYFDPDVHGKRPEALASWIYNEKVVRGRRVIVVGWSYGLVNALDSLKVLARQGVCVDKLIGIDCFLLNYHRGEQLQPRNVGEVVLIYRKIARLPRGFRSPKVYRVGTVRHLAMARHTHTVNALLNESRNLIGLNSTPRVSTSRQ